MRRILVILAACLLGHAAWAHAFLDRATPAVGSEVSGSPPALTLTFSEPVEPLFSTVEVKNASGTVVSDGKPTPNEDGRVLVVRLKTLPPGVYSVAWRVTSVDTHKTEGHFTFTVKP